MSRAQPGRDRSPHRWVLPVISLGGMIGAGARVALESRWAETAGSLPWATLAVNVSGCALLGVLMGHVIEVGGGHVLLRPFLGVGVLGGYTTFSTYAGQTHALLVQGRPDLAMAYLAGTAVTALAAVALGAVVGRTWARTRRSASPAGVPRSSGDHPAAS